MRRMTLRMLIQTLTLDKVICDREAFRAFQLFASSFHAEENVLFYCVSEAFQNRGTKAVGVLGLDDLSKSQHKGLPRTQSHLHQIALDSSRAERMGTTLDRVQMIREATAIYDRFLAPGAPDWVCVEQKVIEDIQLKLHAVKKDAKQPFSRDLFARAKEFVWEVVGGAQLTRCAACERRYVFKNMEHDLLPRFLKVALAPEQPKDGTSDDDEVDTKAMQIFKADEVLRHHLLQLQKKPLTSMNGTANAFRSLFPSPRYAIEGREGSGLHPDSLTHFDNLNLNEGVIAKPTELPYSRKSLSLSVKMLRPFSMKKSSSAGEPAAPPGAPVVAKNLESQHFATADVSGLDRRNSTGMNRGHVIRGGAGFAGNRKSRSRSKSDGEVKDVFQVGEMVDLDALVFSVRGGALFLSPRTAS
jgi:hypothetical protein